MLKATILAAVTVCLGTGCALSAPAKLWEVTGLKAPESALPDVERGVIFVSNVSGGASDKDGTGFISKVSLDGKVLALKWVTGLDAPKCLARVGERLYVSDIDRLVEIDIKGGKIVAQHEARGAKFFNDVAADAQGRVYVSDTDKNTIWRLADGRFEPWLTSNALDSPNGLLVEGDKLIIAAWGVAADNDQAGMPASLVEVSLADKSVRKLGDGTPVGNLDGIEPLAPGAYLVTDWVAGALYRIDALGKAQLLLDLNPGSADLGYIPSTKTVLIPLMKDNKLAAYHIE
jgi:outer membrane protein assembly factor BamB